tara:strand:- start:22119 stop:23033 length:915 start_codon:yes stop_codon:yes gene_type:complete
MDKFCFSKKIKEKFINIYILILLSLLCLNLSIGNHVFAQDIRLVAGYASAYAITAKESGLEGSIKNPATSIKNINKKILVNINESYGMEIYHGLLGFGYEYIDDIFVTALLPFSSIADIAQNEVINEIPTKIGQYNALHMYPQLSVTKRINSKMLIGSSVIGIYDRISNEVGKGFSVDTGILLTGEIINMGISLQNIGNSKFWSTGKIDHKPLQLNTGIAIKPIRNLEFLTDMSIIKEKMIKNIALIYDISSYLNLTVGVRDIGTSNQVRSGANMILNSFSMHYSYGYHMALGDSHKLGMTLDI